MANVLSGHKVVNSKGVSEEMKSLKCYSYNHLVGPNFMMSKHREGYSELSTLLKPKWLATPVRDFLD